MSNRKKEYDLATHFVNCGNNRFVEKRPLNEKAKNHLKNLSLMESLMEKHLSGTGEVVKGRYTEQVARYDYIPGTTLLDETRICLERGEITESNSCLKNYFQLIDSMRTGQFEPSQFLMYLNSQKKNILDPLDCLTFAPLDLVPSNIIKHHGKNYFIDCEWVFDFPAPVDFIKFRGLITAIYSLQPSITSASEKYRLDIIPFTGLRRKTYLPRAWRSFFNDFQIPTKVLFRWNYLFQKKYLVRSRQGFLWI